MVGASRHVQAWRCSSDRFTKDTKYQASALASYDLKCGNNCFSFTAHRF